MAAVILSALAIFNAAQQEWDTGDRNAYQDTQFYQDTDPADWKDEYIQWDQVPDDRIADIPADKLRFDKMKSSQMDKVTAEQAKTRITDLKPKHVGMLSDDTISGLDADDADSYLSQRLTESPNGKYVPDNPKEWRLIRHLFPNMDESLYMRKTDAGSQPIRRDDLLFTREEGHYAISSGTSSAVMLDHNVALTYEEVPEGSPEYLKVGRVTMKDARLVVHSNDHYTTHGLYDAEGLGQFNVHGATPTESMPIPLHYGEVAEAELRGPFIHYRSDNLFIYDTQASFMPEEGNQIRTIFVRNVEGATSIRGTEGNFLVSFDGVQGQHNILSLGTAGREVVHVDEDYNQHRYYATEGGWKMEYVSPPCEQGATGNTIADITGMVSYGMCGQSGLFSFIKAPEQGAERLGEGLSEIAIRQLTSGEKVEIIRNHEPETASSDAAHVYERTMWWCYGSATCKDMCQRDESCALRMAERLPE
jgi:hypothetical protein